MKITIAVVVLGAVLVGCGSPIQPTSYLGILSVAPALMLLPIKTPGCFTASYGTGKYHWVRTMGTGTLAQDGPVSCYQSSSAEQFVIEVTSGNEKIVVGGRTY